MTLAEMLADLPQACDVGTKRNAKGYKETWVANRFPAERRRLRERTNAERVNGRFKDEFGGRGIHVRGPVNGRRWLRNTVYV